MMNVGIAIAVVLGAICGVVCIMCCIEKVNNRRVIIIDDHYHMTVSGDQYQVIYTQDTSRMASVGVADAEANAESDVETA